MTRPIRCEWCCAIAHRLFTYKSKEDDEVSSYIIKGRKGYRIRPVLYPFCNDCQPTEEYHYTGVDLKRGDQS